MGNIPRVLADDFSFVCFGPDREPLDSAVERSMLFTVQYVDHIGGTLAIKKSTMFSSSPESRQLFASSKWGRDQQHMLVITDFRDLGLHIDLTGWGRSSTLNHRIDGTLNEMRNLHGNCPPELRPR